MTDANNTTFTAAALIAVESAKVAVQPRMNKLPKPVYFYFENNGQALPAGTELTDEFLKRHQVGGKVPSSYIGRMPNVQLAKEGKNPYSDISNTDTVVTLETYRHLLPVAPQVWDVLSKSKTPLLASEIMQAIAKKNADLSKVKWFNEAVRSTLVDLCMFGLAQRDTVKVNVSKTRFRAADAKAIEIAAK